MEYEKQLGSNTEVVEAFDGIVAEFEEKYMNVLTNTFGPGVQENINFDNLEESVGNIILTEYNRVWEVYNRFTRGYGSAGRTAGARRMRFAQAMNSWNFFVTGFGGTETRVETTYNEETHMEEVVHEYEEETHVGVEVAAFTDLAVKFYEWSAQLDQWIHEIYTLQMTLDMMVNEWAVKIALKT